MPASAFPGLREELDISSQADLRRTVRVEAFDGKGSCAATYARDIEPRIGRRVALACRPSAWEGGVPDVDRSTGTAFADVDADGDGSGDT